MPSDLLLAAILTILFSVPAVPAEKTSNGPENKQNDKNTCNLYMAPSSLDGIDGFGVYTTKDLPKNSVLLNAPDGPSIPVIDYNDGEQDDEIPDWVDLFDSYWWGHGVSDQVLNEANIVADFQVTFGSLPNHHCVLDSVDHRFPRVSYNDTMVNRTRDPGAGSFSYHTGREFFVARNVQAGEELFLNYGKCEYDEDYPEWADHVVKTNDFKMAVTLVKRWNVLKESDDGHNMDETMNEEQRLFFDELISEVSNAVSIFNERAASILPKSYKELTNVMTTTPSLSSRDIAMGLAKEIGTTKRSVDWIRQNGMCIDNIVPGPSQLPQAGQGAIAQRYIAKGDIVVPVPMLHILDRDVLRITGTDGSKSDQLLLNYCFGHTQSSLLLCPLTNAILINHCSARRGDCGKDGPNAEYRWASGWDSKTNRWLKMTLEELAEESGRGLSMEIIATREIQEGDEIYIDYGREWENAWAMHVSSWKPPAPDGAFQTYASPSELNEKDDPLQTLVSRNLRKIDQHPNLFTGCLFWETQYDKRRRMSDPFWKNRDDDVILRRYSTSDGADYTGDYASEMDGSYWPCSVIRSDSEDGTLYTVRILQSKFRDPTEWHKQSLPRFVTNFPRGSIRYFNKPYTSDQHLPGAFRHHIEIRNDIFPDQWKDRK